MKKYSYPSFCFILLFILSTIFIGCSAKKTLSSTNTPIKIGVVQLLEHQSLDEIYEGILDELSENGYQDGKNIEIDYRNGQGEQSNLKTINQIFVNNQSDIIIAIATGAALSAAAETSTIPVVATAVTDLEATSLVESNENPGGNVTGVSDMTVIKDQIDILLELSPDAKTIGITYCSSEMNSEIQSDIAQKYIKSLGLACIVSTVATTNDMVQTIDSLTDKVDAVYIPSDNTLSSTMPTVMAICEPKKIPVIASASGMVKDGALAAVALDYYSIGRQTGKMVIRILKGDSPATTPVETVEGTKLYINKTYADSISLIIPKELLDKAAEIY